MGIWHVKRKHYTCIQFTPCNE